MTKMARFPGFLLVSPFLYNLFCLDGVTSLLLGICRALLMAAAGGDLIGSS